jgi:acetyltransferase-like isoleucine patch superfamily enzyme
MRPFSKLDLGRHRSAFGQLPRTHCAPDHPPKRAICPKEQYLESRTVCCNTWRGLPRGGFIQVWCHRSRGVTIGKDAWIGYDASETSYPHLISIGDRTVISVRTTIVAHFHGSNGVRIEEDVFIGPGVIILPNLTIGKGAVVSAGSVVTTSVPPWTVVQGNPAKPIAKSALPLGMTTPIKEFLSHLRPLPKKRAMSSG